METAELNPQWADDPLRQFWLRWDVNAVEFGRGKVYDPQTILQIVYFDTIFRPKHLSILNRPVQFPMGMLTISKHILFTIT